MPQPEQGKTIVTIHDVLQRAASDPTYRRYLLGIAAKRKTEHYITPEDTIQTATEEVLRRASTIRDSTSGQPEGYFHKLIFSRAADSGRRRAMAEHHGLRSLEEEAQNHTRGMDGILIQSPRREPGPETQVIRNELAQEVASALKSAHLSDVDRAIFLSRHFEELGHDALSERYQDAYQQKTGKKLTPNIVKASLNRSKTKLSRLPQMQQLWKTYASEY